MATAVAVAVAAFVSWPYPRETMQVLHVRRTAKVGRIKCATATPIQHILYRFAECPRLVFICPACWLHPLFAYGGSWSGAASLVLVIPPIYIYESALNPTMMMVSSLSCYIIQSEFAVLWLSF